MKLPWKFLVQLTTRRRKEHAQDSSVGDGREPEAVESKETHRSALASGSLEAYVTTNSDERNPVDRTVAPANETGGDPDAAGAKSPSVNEEEAYAARYDENGHSKAGTDALEPESETSAQSRSTRRIRRPARAKRAFAQMVVQSDAAANEDNDMLSSSSGNPYFDEVADLDEEIGRLKVMLAQKLHLQNVQLKKMLERFDVS